LSFFQYTGGNYKRVGMPNCHSFVVDFARRLLRSADDSFPFGRPPFIQHVANGLDRVGLAAPLNAWIARKNGK
jgi:hypothetical protein